MAVRLLSNQSVNGDIDVNHSQNAITYVAVTNLNTGVSANARVQVVGETSQLDLIATSAGYTGVTGWADSGIISTDSGASGGLKLNAQAGGLQFQIAASTTMYIMSAGLVGINNDCAATALSVKDTQDTAFTSGISIIRSANSDTGYINMVGGAFNLNSSKNTKLRVSDVTKLEVRSSGINVIGETETDTLKVTGLVTLDGDIDITGGVITLGVADTSSGHINAYENLTFNIDIDNDDTTRYFGFYTNGSDGSGTELVRIAEDGNVAIQPGGATLTNTRLYVVSADNYNPSLFDGMGGIRIGSGGSSSAGDGNYTGGIGFAITSGTSGIAGVQKGADADKQGLAFFTHPSDTGGDAAVEKMRLDADGNLGIGTDSPTSQLHIKNTSGDNRGILVDNTVAASYAEVSVKSDTREFRLGTGGSSTSDNANNVFYVYDATTGGVAGHRFEISSAGEVQARRPRSNTAGEVGLGVQPTDTTAHYGWRIDQTSNNLNLDYVNTPLNIMSYSTTGNVGIGTTPFPANLTPQTVLDIGNAASVWGYQNYAYLIANAYYNVGWLYKNTAPAGVLQIAGDELSFRQAGSGTADTTVTYNQPFTIKASGNVGIGTTNPLHDLQIGTAATNGSYSMLIEGNFANDALASNPRLNLIDTNFGITAGKYGSGTSDDALGFFAFQGPGRGIVFAHTTAGSGTHLKDMRQDMFIDGNTGNVGIGTTSPSSKLTIVSEANVGSLEFLAVNAATTTNKIIFSEAILGDESFFIEHDGAGAGAANLLKIFGDGAGGTAGGITIQRDGKVGIGTTSPETQLSIGDYTDTAERITIATSNDGTGRINFYDNNNTEGGSMRVVGESGGSKMYFTNRWNTDNDRVVFDLKLGNVGINDTGPSQKLSVVGDGSGTSDVVRITHGNGSHTGSGLSIRSANTGKAIYVDGSVGAGFAEITTAYNANPNIRTSGDVVAYASSDKRFKDNLEVIQNPIDKIHKLNGYTFNWNDKQDVYKGKDYGVVAQEVEKVMPELVDTRFDGYKAVKYEKLVPLLIESIKELKAEIEELKKNR